MIERRLRLHYVFAVFPIARDWALWGNPNKPIIGRPTKNTWISKRCFTIFARKFRAQCVLTCTLIQSTFHVYTRFVCTAWNTGTQQVMGAWRNLTAGIWKLVGALSNSEDVFKTRNVTSPKWSQWLSVLLSCLSIACVYQLFCTSVFTPFCLFGCLPVYHWVQKRKTRRRV